VLLVGFLAAGCTFGSLDTPVPPTDLTYSTNPAVYPLGVEMTPNLPTSKGGAVLSYAVWPALPAGLRLDPATGAITGTPLLLTTIASFTVTATNDAGSTTASLDLTVASSGIVPGPPLGVTATPDVRSAALSWDAPLASGSGPVSGYLVLVAPPTPTSTVSVAGTTALVTGLANGASYSFTVVASNAAGAGPASLPTAPITTPDLPAAPGNLTAAAGNGWVSLSWTAPAQDGGRPLTGYGLIVSPEARGAVLEVAGLTGLVTGLSNGVAYTFQVHAVTAVGDGPPSAASAAVTPSAGACVADAACAGGGWCLAGSCQAAYGLSLSSSIAPAADGRTYASRTVPLVVGVTGGAPMVELTLVGMGRLQVLGPPAYAFTWDTSTLAQGTYRLVATAHGGSRTYTSLPLEIVVDRTAPQVISRAPQPGTAAASNADWRSPITVQFSEVLDASALLAPGNVLVLAGTTALPTTLARSADGTTLTIQLTEPPPSTDVAVTLQHGITDLAGNGLAATTWRLVFPEWLELAAPFQEGLSTSGGLEVKLVVDALGRPVAAFNVPGVHTGPGTKVIRRWTGEAWQDLPLGGASSPGCVGGLALDPSGLPVMVWDQTPPVSAVEVCTGRWSGTTWERACPPGPRVDPLLHQLDCRTALQVGSTGRRVIAYRDSLDALQASELDGAQWTLLTSGPLATSAEATSDVEVSVDAGGQARVSWAGAAGISVWSHGAALPTLLPYPSLAARASFGPARMDSTGRRPAGVVLDSSGSATTLSVQQYGCGLPAGCGLDPAPWQRLGGTLNVDRRHDASLPALALDPTGNPVVAWREGGEIFARRWTGAAWLPLGVGHVATDGKITGLALAVGPAGHVIVSWTASVGKGTGVTIQLYDR
jgi:hypothetical protein